MIIKELEDMVYDDHYGWCKKDNDNDIPMWLEISNFIREKTTTNINIVNKKLTKVKKVYRDELLSPKTKTRKKKLRINKRIPKRVQIIEEIEELPHYMYDAGELSTYDFILKPISQLKIIDRYDSHISKQSGMYILMNDECVVKVGETNNVYNRICSHKSNKRWKWNKYCYISCNEVERRILEVLYIDKYKPKYNKGLK